MRQEKLSNPHGLAPLFPERRFVSYGRHAEI